MERRKEKIKRKEIFRLGEDKKQNHSAEDLEVWDQH